ncbi:ribonuclease R [Chondrinema litorale]|uniref:ribonuclease R n=1 Tax=Chondrinema litorale TaxID=2994555 RepID=UPI002543F6D7|nr:ribonuclease R [Chondrinema litorale]UZR92480.1 ribonuclease R [Chondrinema litorale]
MKKSRKKNKTTKSKGPKNANLKLLKESVLQFLNSTPQESFSFKKICQHLSVKKQKMKTELGAVLDQLSENQQIAQNRDGRYQSLGIEASKNELTGTVDFVNPAFAYIVLEDKDDIRISADKLNGALHGDTVNIILYKNPRRGKIEAKVVEIVKRKTNEFAGHIEISKHFAFVVSNSRKMHTDIYVSPEDYNGAQNLDKVIVEVKEWAKNDNSPVGVVKKVLGKAGENDTEIHAIMFEYGLPFEFPEKVEAEANSISDKITSKEISKRRDFRDTLTFTIDPEDAKDFDDALSIKKLENGFWEVGVHIADVTHYVQPGSEIEKEGYKRATSVYLVDRTIPMLPERLSNGLCSLRPQEEKLTFSAVFTLDNEANIKDEWFGRTAIYSDHRFSYEDAQQTLETGEGKFAEEVGLLNNLAKKLKEKRFQNGAIAFESVELKFKLDENGKPLGLFPKVRKDTHKLVEEFMLLANKRVAEYVYNLKKENKHNTMVYRVHEDPDPEKILKLAEFVKRFGYKISLEKNKLSGSLNSLSEEVEGRPEQNVVQSQAIRAMSKARYTTTEIGHYGLAFKHYSHFTSPIRRYPDMMAHRLLQHYLDGNNSPDKAPYEEKCKHSSEREKVAVEAERASIKYKQVEFMEQYLHKDFDGVISGTTEWGIYVELDETKCEGMIRLADMKDDFYSYDEKNQCVVGKRFNEKFMIGDKVRVRVKGTNLEKRTIDLEMK